MNDESRYPQLMQIIKNNQLEKYEDIYEELYELWDEFLKQKKRLDDDRE